MSVSGMPITSHANSIGRWVLFLIQNGCMVMVWAKTGQKQAMDRRNGNVRATEKAKQLAGARAGARAEHGKLAVGRRWQAGESPIIKGPRY